FRLLHELQPPRVISRRGGKRRLIARKNHHANLLDARLQHFFDDDVKSRFLRAIAIHQCLERERTLIFARGGDDGFFDFHNGKPARSESQNGRATFKTKTVSRKIGRKDLTAPSTNRFDWLFQLETNVTNNIVTSATPRLAQRGQWLVLAAAF